MTPFECVPNFSEGRNAELIEALVAPARSTPGVTVLDVERDASHNRCVVSLVGDGEALLGALLAMMRVAVEKIDLNHHQGEHPRMGAVDVVPFVPIGTSSMEEAVHLAEKLAERSWSELKLPVYLYGEAARRPEHADLAEIRRGEFEGIRDAISRDEWRRPDVGEPHVHPTAGIVAIGARPVLIAYNAYLTTPEVAVAQRVAAAVRHRGGGLAEVKAKGFDIRERQRAQVSMNLTDYRKTPIHRALELVRVEAGRFGARVEESEVVGLVPLDALLDAAEFYLQLNRFDRANILERKVAAAGVAPGSSDEPPSTLARLRVEEFLDRLGARSPTPGGGSASALAGALGAALGEMVFHYSSRPGSSVSELAPVLTELGSIRREFLEAVDADADAYELVRTRRRAKTESPQDPAAVRGWFQSLRQAAEVPLATARRADRAHQLLTHHRERVRPALTSDLVTALALLRAAREGALANVATNLDVLREAGEPVADLEAESARLGGAL